MPRRNGATLARMNECDDLNIVEIAVPAEGTLDAINEWVGSDESGKPAGPRSGEQMRFLPWVLSRCHARYAETK
jgi:hypothetical protein